MTQPWSLVIPILDEVELLKQTFPNYVALEPNEILLCLNEVHPQEIENIATKLCHNTKTELKIVTIPKNSGWRFLQAGARVEGFKSAKYDRILNIDIDNILYPSVLDCMDFLGHDNVALVSFRKDINYSISTMVREKSRRLQFLLTKRRGGKPIMGAYWIYRPYYFNIINEEEYKLIWNGSDTYFQWKFNQPNKYNHIYVNKSCCKSLRGENEELSWRQLEIGLYFACRNVSLKKVLRYTFLDFHPLVFRGYCAGLKLPDYVRKFIGALSYNEFIMFHDNRRWLS